MNKAKLVDTVSKETGQPKEVVQQVLDAGFNATTQALAAGDTVKIVGFGTYKVQVRPAREARNPRTGEPVSVVESKTVKFKPFDAVLSAL